MKPKSKTLMEILLPKDTESCAHTPDFSTARHADGTSRDEGIIDVTCKKCGASGSFHVDPTEVNF